MRKVGAVLFAGAIAGAGLVMAAPSPAGADEVVTVCITITPKSVSVRIDDQTIIGPTVEQPRTCIGI